MISHHEPLSGIADMAADLAERAVESVRGQVIGRPQQSSTTTNVGHGTSAPRRAAVDGVAGLLGALDRLLAAVVVTLMLAERQRVIAEEGLTTESWLRAVARRTGADAAMLMIAAERLADMPATLSAFCDGALSWGSVRGIVASVKALTADQRRWLDASLAGDAARLRCLDGDDAVALADRLSEIARPDLHARRADRAAANQHLTFQAAMDGTATAHAAMDAETFATVQQAIETITHDVGGRRVASNVEALRALARQRLDNVAASGSPANDQTTAAAGGERNPADRAERHHAQSGVAEAAAHGERDGMPTGVGESRPAPAPAASHDGAAACEQDHSGTSDAARTSRSVRTEMIVVTDVALLAGPSDRQPGGAPENALAGSSIADPVRTTAHVLWRQDRPPVTLTRPAVRRLACDATLRPVLVDGAEVLGTAEPYARVSAALRTALIARDGHCRFAGCHRPVDVCDAHHVVHRLDGGPTVLANLALLCGAHHRAVHEGGWTATLHDDASMTFTRRGVVLSSLPRGQRLPHPAGRPPPGRRSRQTSQAPRSRSSHTEPGDRLSSVTGRRRHAGQARTADLDTTGAALPF